MNKNYFVTILTLNVIIIYMFDTAILQLMFFFLFIVCTYYVSPRQGRETRIVFPRASVRPSVHHKSCPLYNLKTVKDFSMKLSTLVNHDKTVCHAQEP